MKTAIAIGGVDVDRKGGFTHSVEYVVECEKLGVDVAWSAEAWGTDAFTPLAFLAAKTTKISSLPWARWSAWGTTSRR